MGFSAGTVGFNLFLSAAIAVGTNTVGFLIAMVTKTHKITDLIGCGTFAVSAWATLAAASHGHNLDVFSNRKPLFLTVAVTCWSVRLAGFLFYRVLQTGTDKRLDMFYPDEGEGWFTGPSKYPFKLAGFWVAQAVWNFTVLLPVTVAQAARPSASMGAWGWIGFALFMGFFTFEAAADFQKDWFKKQPGNKDQFVNTGLYKLCQFPNYFGEICVWWSMYFWAGLPGIAASHAYIIISPVVTTLLLRFGSGVATLKPAQEKRYGSRQDYRDYCASTPLLIPFFKPLYVGRTAQQPLMEQEGSGHGGQDSGVARSSGESGAK